MMAFSSMMWLNAVLLFSIISSWLITQMKIYEGIISLLQFPYDLWSIAQSKQEEKARKFFCCCCLPLRCLICIYFYYYVYIITYHYRPRARRGSYCNYKLGFRGQSYL